MQLSLPVRINKERYFGEYLGDEVVIYLGKYSATLQLDQLENCGLIGQHAIREEVRKNPFLPGISRENDIYRIKKPEEIMNEAERRGANIVAQVHGNSSLYVAFKIKSLKNLESLD